MTVRAGQKLTEVARPPHPTLHPGPVLPRRIVPDVLCVSTFQLSDPIAENILVKADDTFHFSSRLSRSSRIISLVLTRACIAYAKLRMAAKSNRPLRTLRLRGNPSPV